MRRCSVRRARRRRSDLIYVYALTDPLDAPPPGDLGFAGAPLETLVDDDVGAVFSTCATSPAANAENLWRHEAVTEALMRGGAVLPTRFGTTLTGLPRLRAVLVRNRAAIRAGLEHVRGCVEVGVRVLVRGGGGRRATVEPGAVGPESEQPRPNGASPDSGVGRAYLLGRLAEERRQRAEEHGAEVVARDVHVPLARYARDTVRRPARGAGVLAAAYLVERDRLDGFVAAVRNVDRERADRQVVCTGPWAPYSFAPMLELEGSVDA